MGGAHLKFGLRMVTSKLQTFIWVGFVKKTLDLQLWLLKLRSHIPDIYEGNWVWKVRGSSLRIKHDYNPYLYRINKTQ